MTIVRDAISIKELATMTHRFSLPLVKAVVDIEREVMAVDGDMHADLEQLLLEDGASGEYLWGINLYPDNDHDTFIEYDSLINLKPHAGNLSRFVDDPERRERIRSIAERLVVR